MWTCQKSVSNLRVGLTLLMRVHLCPERFNSTSRRSLSGTQEKTVQKKTKSVKKPRHLFEVIIKLGKGKSKREIY